MSLKRKVIIGVLILLLLIVFASIFRFSSEDGVESKSVSKPIAEQVVKEIGKISQTENLKTVFEHTHKIIRKLAHFSLYTLVGIISMCIVLYTINVGTYKQILISFLIGFVYAISDEIHQLFVPGRTGEIRDVLIDCTGVIAGILIVIGIKKLYQIRTTKNKKVM